MGKKDRDPQGVPVNWADFAYAGAHFVAEALAAGSNAFNHLAISFATHSVYKDQAHAAKARQDKFAEKAGLEIERMVSGDG
jgi:hypothetical protein